MRVNDSLEAQEIEERFRKEQQEATNLKRFEANVETNAGIRSITFPNLPDAIELVFTRFKENSSYEVRADLEVYYRTFNRQRPVYDSRINLRGDRNKLDAAKRCALEIGAFDAWGDVIESGCRAALADFRQGEPLLELRDVPKRLAINYSVYPICPSNQPTIIFGMGGLGKSLLCCYLAARASLGDGFDEPLRDQLGVRKKHRILYLDYEADAEEVKDRFDRLSVGIGIEMPSLKYRFCHQRLSDEIETIQKIVQEEEITMICVDSAGPASGGEPEKSQAAMDFFTAIRTLKCTTVVVAHQAKPQPGTNNGMPFGSAFWWNMARSIWQIDKEGEPGTDRIEVGLFHRKVNSGRLHRPLGFRFEFVEDLENPTRSMIKVQRLSLDKSELRKQLPLLDHIKALLYDTEITPDGLLTAQQLAEFTEKPMSTISPTLSKAKGKGILYMSGTDTKGRERWGVEYR